MENVIIGDGSLFCVRDLTSATVQEVPEAREVKQADASTPLQQLRKDCTALL